MKIQSILFGILTSMLLASNVSAEGWFTWINEQLNSVVQEEVAQPVNKSNQITIPQDKLPQMPVGQQVDNSVCTTCECPEIAPRAMELSSSARPFAFTARLGALALICAALFKGVNWSAHAISKKSIKGYNYGRYAAPAIKVLGYAYIVWMGSLGFYDIYNESNMHMLTGLSLQSI